MEGYAVTLWIIGILVFIIILKVMLKTVRDYQRIVVFRLGRCIGAFGPGLVVLIPIVDVAVWVDLREQSLEVPGAEYKCIIRYKIVNPLNATLNVKNISTGLQAIVAQMMNNFSKADVTVNPERAKQILLEKLEEMINRWGIEITSIGFEDL